MTTSTEGKGKQNGKEGRVLKVKCFLQVVEDAQFMQNDQVYRHSATKSHTNSIFITCHCIFLGSCIYAQQNINSFAFIEKLCTTNRNYNLIYKV